MNKPFQSDYQEHEVRHTAGSVTLEGTLGVPSGARGAVVFAHGSGSGRYSPRNRSVAQALREAGLATLLIDLLTSGEEQLDAPTARFRFDVGLLAKRLLIATDWLTRDPQTEHLAIGYFGASTGAGAALVAAAQRPELIGAVVSRGGRPDLAAADLGRVCAPTMPESAGLYAQVRALARPLRRPDEGGRAMLFRDRTHAGRVLATKLKKYADRPDVVVLGLPRGGVPVAFEVARALNAPLDVFQVRKLGVPGQEELALGAIASSGVRVVNEDVVRSLRISDKVIDAVAAEEQRELERRARAYRGDRPAPELVGRTVILIDDGLATGSTMRAAVAALRKQGPSRIIVAAPVGAPRTCEELAQEADETVCARTPEPFYSVGLWYGDFSQTTDEEVRDLLERAAQGRAPSYR